jgi:hypothetical protein
MKNAALSENRRQCKFLPWVGTGDYKSSSCLNWFWLALGGCSRGGGALQSPARNTVTEIISGGDMKKLAVVVGLILMAAGALAQANLALPTGTPLKVRLDKTLSTFSSKPGDPFTAHVQEAVTVDGKTVIPVGATVEGRVTKVTEPRRIAGRPTIAIFPETLVLPSGEHFALNAALVDTNRGRGTDVNDEGQFKGSGHDGKDKVEIGLGAGGGMLGGGLIAGGPGVLIGGGVGAGVTVGHWLSKRNSAALPAGTILFMELSRPLEMTVASGAE